MIKAWHERTERRHRVIVFIGGVEHRITTEEAKSLASAIGSAIHNAWCARMTDWIQGGKQGEEPKP